MNSEQATEALGNMSTGAATCGGIITYIEAHAPFFGILISCCGLLLAAFFYAANYRLRKRYLEKEYQLKKTQLLNEGVSR